MSVRYEIQLSFTDTSYWDDGNRRTTRTLGAKKLREVKELIDMLLNFPFTYHGLGGQDQAIIRPENIQVSRVTTTNVSLEKLGLKGLRPPQEKSDD